MTDQQQSEVRSPWIAFAVTVSVAVLTILDVVKVNVVLTPLEETLQATPAQTGLVVAGYVLAFGIALVPSGRLGDQWNRKAMFMIGLVIFAVASLGAALAPTASLLVIARILQGIAAGILMPQVLGMIQTIFQGQARGQAFGILGAAIGLGTAFGPTIGGLFLGGLGSELGWRWTFGMNVPLVLLVIPLALWLIPAAQPREGRADLDIVGVLLMAVSVLCVMLPFVLTTGSGDHPARWALLGLGAVTAYLFVRWENRYRAAGKSPVLDFTLFTLSSYRNGVIITTLFFAAMPAMFLVMTLFNQQGLGHDPVVVGLITVPYAVVSAIVAAVVGKYTYRHATGLIIWGFMIFIAALIGLVIVAAVVPPEHNPLAMAIVLAIAGVGPGFIMAANQMRTLMDVPVTQGGVAGSFQQVGQRLGNAIGIAVGSAIFYSLVVAVPRDASGLPDPTNPSSVATYAYAFQMAMVVLIMFSVVALVFAGIDHRARSRQLAEQAAASIGS
ncbi:MFS transporter [Enteractinococcus coprophilus]|uniref:Putative MFS family arabinose efflux permease n=1 Tax=Enteractinococcus coprophilus TaxID=1027633 RepID=A0A543AM99_9MICC|nr:MFS transporter [Enteractinococcus coprophilus]TQL73724.1 putative MFS family arabinose efflux permease [Enteractinococcus coprophilus]